MADWDDTFEAGLDGLLRDWEAAAPIALGRGGMVLKSGAMLRAPIESGHLRGSADVTVHGTGWGAVCTLKFPGPYARRQEFELTWRHPRGGQALYLTTTLRVDGPNAVRAVADALRSIT